MSIDVQRAFRELMLRNSAVAALVDRRVYPNSAAQTRPDEEPDSYIVYWLLDRTRPRTLKSPKRLAHTRIQVDVYAREYADAHNIADAVGLATDGFNGTVEVTEDDTTEALLLRSVELLTLEDIYEASADGREFGWHRVSIDFMIWHEMEIPVVV